MTVLWIVTRSDKPPAPLYSEVRFGLPEAALAVQYVREYSEALDEDDEREQEDARVQAVLYADHAVLPLMEAGLHPFFQTYYAHLVDVAAPGAQPDVLATIKVSLPDVARLTVEMCTRTSSAMSCIFIGFRCCTPWRRKPSCRRTTSVATRSIVFCRWCSASMNHLAASILRRRYS